MASSLKLTVKSPSARQRVKQAALGIPGFTWQQKSEQYCDYRLDGTQGGHWLRIKQFNNGTLYIEASSEAALAHFQQQALSDTPGGQVITKPITKASASAQLGLMPDSGGFVSPIVLPPATAVRGQLDLTGAYVGTDESGKGDYFGPLVIAGVYVDEVSIAKLLEVGVMDSKKLTDTLIFKLSQQIIDIVGEEAVAVVEMGPKKYNELYERLKSQQKNLNHLLAWGHAMAIETLLEQNPTCQQAVADQFGNEMYIKSQLKEKGKRITLYQTPKAEANIGVAAASIIARHRFVAKVQQLSQHFGVTLPLGANPVVKTQAKLFIAQHGLAQLGEVAKLHFKTTQELS